MSDDMEQGLTETTPLAKKKIKDLEPDELRKYNAAAKRKSNGKKKAQAEESARQWDSPIEVSKAEAKGILKERGVKNIHVIDILYDLYRIASQHYKIPLNDYLFRAGLRTTLKAIEQEEQLTAPEIADGLVIGESGQCIETLFNRDLWSIWDASLFREPDVTYDEFKQVRYNAKTDAFYLGKELLARDFSKCHREWVDTFYPHIKPDGLIPEYSESQMKDWWSAQVENQPKEYVQLASRSSFKSSTAVVFLISIICQCADTRCALVSEVSKLSKDFIKSMRHFLETGDEHNPSRFAQYFPEHQIAPGDSSVLSYASPLAHLGLPQPQAHAIGMDSSAQGLRANLVLVDDPISVLTVKEKEQREASVAKYDMLKNIRERSGLIFLVGTPYHPEDLFKTVITRNEDSTDGSFISRIDPAFRVRESGQDKDLADLLPEDVDLLFEEQLPFAELMRSLKSNRRFFLSQQLCQFVEVEETVKLNFDRDFLRTCIVAPSLVPAIGDIYLVIDSASSAGPAADMSALAVVRIAVNDQNQKTMYVLDLERDRLRGSELALRICMLTRKWSPRRCIIEKPLSWDLLQAEIQRVGMKYNVSIPMYAAPVSNKRAAKLLRLKGLEILFGSGQIKLVSGGYIDALFDELEKLSGSHTAAYRSSSSKRDDQADALSIAQKYLLPATLKKNADSGRCRSAFRADADHSFRAMSISDSGGCRSLIPG